MRHGYEEEKYIKEYLTEAIHGDEEAARKFNELKIRSSITLTEVVGILSDNDLKLCPESILYPLLDVLAEQPLESIFSLLDGLRGAKKNTAAQTALAFILSKHISREGLEIILNDDKVKTGEFEVADVLPMLGMIESQVKMSYDQVQPLFESINTLYQQANSGDVKAVSGLGFLNPEVLLAHEESLLIGLSDDKKKYGYAYFQLANYYRDQGSHEKAGDYYRLAANRGVGKANRELATFYQQGVHVTQNLPLAESLCRQAIALGDHEAIALLVDLNKDYKACEAFELGIPRLLNYHGRGLALCTKATQHSLSSAYHEKLELYDSLVQEIVDSLDVASFSGVVNSAIAKYAESKGSSTFAFLSRSSSRKRAVTDRVVGAGFNDIKDVAGIKAFLKIIYTDSSTGVNGASFKSILAERILELSDKAEMIKQISNDPYQLIGAFMKVEMTLSADARIDLHDSPCVADEYSSESGMSLGS